MRENNLKFDQRKYEKIIQKKIQKIIIGAMFLLIIPLTLGCSKSLADREITITAEKEIIDNVIIGAGQNYKKIFIDYISSGNVKEVKLGDKIVLDFGDKSPDRLVIKEWILSDKGDIVYVDERVNNHEYYDAGNGSYYFTIDEDLLAIIGTDPDEVNGIYRGIRIEASWEFESEAYILVCKPSKII